MTERARDEHRPQQRRLPAAVRRERVLAGALELFGDQGYAASMGDIARAAGVTRTVLYHYFPSKDDLFGAVLEAQAGELLRHLAPAIAGEGTQAERARVVIDALLAFVETRPQAWQLLFEHRDDDVAAVAHARQQVHDMVMTSAGVLFASDMTAVGVGPRSARAAILGEGALGAAVAVARWWRAHPDVPRQTVADAVFDMLWLGADGLA